jgi:hypothetical protein
MPNYCTNILTLNEPWKNLEKIIGEFLDEEKNLDFDKIVPMPKGLVNKNLPNPEDKSPQAEATRKKRVTLLKKLGVKDWHQWAMIHWGTKWSPDGTHMEEPSLSFCTAWSPPIPAIIALAKKTKTSWTLEYAEMGNNFCGRLVAGPEGPISDVNWEPREAPKSFLRKIGVREEEIYTPDELRERDELRRRRKSQRKAKIAVRTLQEKAQSKESGLEI